LLEQPGEERRGLGGLLPQSTLGLIVLGTAGALALALLAALALSSLIGSDGETPEFRGTTLNGAPAPDFTLTDQSGRKVSLSDFRGKTVLLSFMFTQCPDVCPLMANKVATVLNQLGADAADVQFLMVSIDPPNDTPANIDAFLAQHGLAGSGALYLNGDEAALQATYRAYGIGMDHAGTHGGVSSISHTDAVYVIDSKGRSRVLARSDFREEDLLADVRSLD
jgi:protein SCO1/2